jgi:hypothetical protein
MTEWCASPTEQFIRDAKRYERKQPNELRAVLANLETLLRVLEVTNGPGMVSCSFFKSEGKGLFRISELGGGASLQPTRLYVTCRVEKGVIELLRVLPKGTKSKQSEQIRTLQDQIAN